VWFPSETIAFEGSLGRLDTVVELEPGASFAGWDIVCLGRPTRGERFDTGRLCSTLAIERGGPLLVERSLYEGGSAVLREPFGLGAEPVYGSLLWVPAEPDSAGSAAELLKSELGGFAVRNAVTAFDGVIAVRALGDRCEQIRELFARAWALLRPRLHGTPACPPRIWST
jgi:urease accessory protein